MATRHLEIQVLLLSVGVGLLPGCRDEKKTPVVSDAAVTPMGMASAVKLIPTTNAIEILTTLQHPADVSLSADRMFLTTSKTEQTDPSVAVSREVIELPLAVGGAPKVLAAAQQGAEGLVYASDRLVWLLAPSEEDSDHTRVVLTKPGAPPKVVAKTFDIDIGATASDGIDVFMFAKTTPDARSDVHRIDPKGKLVRVAQVGLRVSRNALAVNATHVVWAQNGGIVRAPKRSDAAAGDAGFAEPSIVAKLPGAKLQQLAVDDSAVYWTDSGSGDGEWSGRVYRAPFSDGAIETVSDAPHPGSIALDADTIFWTSNSSHAGRVLARKKTGGATYVLARELRGPTSIAVDAKYVYWVNAGDGSVCRAEKTPRAGP